MRRTRTPRRCSRRGGRLQVPRRGAGVTHAVVVVRIRQRRRRTVLAVDVAAGITVVRRGTAQDRHHNQRADDAQNRSHRRRPSALRSSMSDVRCSTFVRSHVSFPSRFPIRTSNPNSNVERKPQRPTRRDSACRNQPHPGRTRRSSTVDVRRSALGRAAAETSASAAPVKPPTIRSSSANVCRKEASRRL